LRTSLTLWDVRLESLTNGDVADAVRKSSSCVSGR
jgi:hypothetical protein